MNPGRAGRRTTTLLGLCLLGSLLACAPALAHAELDRSSPADGETLSGQPGEVRLFFDEPVRAEFDPIKVTDDEGNRVDGEDARTLPDDPDVVEAGLDVLPEGSYTVEWRVTSADGDPVSGEFGFAVDASAAVAGGGGEGPAGGEEAEGPGFGALLGVLLLGGLAVAGFAVLRRR